MESKESKDNGVIYGLDDRPPLGRAIVLGMQHVLTMFGSTVAVPLLFGPVLWPIPEGLPQNLANELATRQLANTATLISSVMLCSGVATMLQSTFGSRLPIIQGVSFSFLAAFFAIIAQVHTDNPIDWSEFLAGDSNRAKWMPLVSKWNDAGATGMRTIAGAIIIGGLLEAAVGFSGLMGQIRKVLSPVVVGPVIMLIGLALYQFGAPYAASNWYVSIATIVLIIAFSLVLSRQIRFLQLFPMLSAIVLVVSVCYGLTVTGHISPDSPAHVDTKAIESSQMFRLTDAVFPWGMPGLADFSVAAVVAVLAGYLASMIESFGDYHACKNMAGGGDPTPDEISRGIAFEGVGCALTGLLGGFSSTSYSENIGLVGLTKVGSRYVVQLGAGMLILLGLFGKFGAIAAAIPQPVVGGLYCTLFGLISAVGVRQFARADLSSERNLLIGGFALFMGLSVPAYFGDRDVSNPKQNYITGQEDIAWMPDGVEGVVLAIGTTGMAVAAILGLLLDNIIPGSKAERGLSHAPGVLAPEAADIDYEPDKEPDDEDDDRPPRRRPGSPPRDS
ncbi:MAG: xanthine permease [Planctomycetaceae bacterium]|nr:xanthine permease [Planctomycetaceae bacterium]